MVAWVRLCSVSRELAILSGSPEFFLILPVDASCAYQWTLPFTPHLLRWTCNGHWQQQFLYDHSSGTIIGLSTDQTHCSIMRKELMPSILLPELFSPAWTAPFPFFGKQKLDRFSMHHFSCEHLWSIVGYSPLACAIPPLQQIVARKFLFRSTPSPWIFQPRSVPSDVRTPEFTWPGMMTKETTLFYVGSEWFITVW